MKTEQERFEIGQGILVTFLIIALGFIFLIPVIPSLKNSFLSEVISSLMDLLK